MKVYIAGPISGNDDYKEQFKRAAAKMESLGFDPVNPAENTCASYRDYIVLGIRQLSECSAIYMIKGWQDSKGARAEREVAKALEIPEILSI